MATTKNVTKVGKRIDQDQYYGSVLGDDGNVYGIPHNADRFARFDPKKGEIMQVGPTIRGRKEKFRTGVLHPVDKCIYTVPFNNDDIVKFDPETNEVEYIPTGVQQHTSKWIGAVVAGNKHIYFIPFCHHNVLKLDVSTKQCTTLFSGGSEGMIRGNSKYFSGGLGSDGNIYCIPRRAPFVLKINVQDDTIEDFGNKFEDEQFSGCVVTSNGDVIYAAPFDRTEKILKIDVVNAKTTLVSETPHGTRWRDLVQATDGMIYGIPYDAKQVFEFDPRNESESVKIIGNSSNSDDKRGKWANGVLAKDGCIYAFPWYRRRILKVIPRNLEEYFRVGTAIHDNETGKDSIGVQQEATAIAQLLTVKDLVPPFTVGLFGGWGSGKTFMFNQIKDVIIKIQKSYRCENQSSYDYAGHIYVVKFDAWTYSKGNIWSSLMYTILTELNKQIQIETILKKKFGPGFFGKSVVEELEALTSNEIEFLDKYNGSTIEKETISKDLAEAVNIAYDYNKEKLDELKLKRYSLKQKESLITNNKFISVLRSVIEETTKDPPPRPEAQNQEAQDRIHDTSVKKISSLTLVKSIWVLINDGEWTNYFYIAIATTFVVPILMWFVLKSFTLLLSSIILPGIATLCRWKTQADEFMAHVQPLLGEIEKYKNWDELKEGIEKEIKNCKKQLAKEQEESRLIEGTNLKDFLNMHKQTGYGSNLDIVHQVQKDLNKLCEALFNEKQKSFFPRGKPRIVLFIDDLDRCPADAVVDTLEALQLLVKSKAFVAVVAMDMQYVTLALEKKYQGILKQGSHPSGLDYLEKIIQLSFRVPPLKLEGSISSYIDSLVTFETSNKSIKNNASEDNKDNSPNEITQTQTQETAQETAQESDRESDQESDEETDRGAEEGTQSDIQENGDATPSTIESGTTLQTIQQISFTKYEIEMLKDIFSHVGTSPRAMKRVVNVCKVLKLIWYRNDPPSYRDVELKKQLQRACVVMLALSASLDPEVRRVMCDILATFESQQLRGFRKSSNLYTVWFENKEAKYIVEKYGDLIKEFKDIKWGNEDDWKNVKYFFRLMRCFCFVGESLSNYDKGCDKRSTTACNIYSFSHQETNVGETTKSFSWIRQKASN